MPLPNYWSPVLQDALTISGGSREDVNSLRSKFNTADAQPTYSPGSPRPITRPEIESRQRLSTLNPLEYEYSNFFPYLQQAQQRADIRTQEQMRKYQRDYRSLLAGRNGATGTNRQSISGTGDRLRGIPANPNSSVSSSSAQRSSSLNISDPITSSFNRLSAVSF